MGVRTIWILQLMVGWLAFPAMLGCAGAAPVEDATGAPALAAFRIDPAWKLERGGIVRGSTSEKKIALVFTAGENGEGSGIVLDTLKKHGIRASMFVTGGYVRVPDYSPWLKRMVAEGHYLGPHSDSHPLYCSWDDRNQTLVTEEFFKKDLQKNIDDLRGYGALQKSPIYFIAPSEWYNEDQVRWARDMGVVLFNFTSGSGSNRDWAPEDHRSFVPSTKILEDVLKYEQKDPNGLNGFLLLLHLGTTRKDKMYLLLDDLLTELENRGYSFVRVDEMLGGNEVAK
jgi:peptidoglycan/xylan/chitin deacetylase (PgdA/CDA1 family)